MVGIAEHWGYSQEQNRHGFCSQDTASLMEKTENKQMHMFSECYEEKCPVLPSSDQGMGTGEGQKGFSAKVMFHRLEVYKELTRGRELPAKDAQASGTKRPELLPGNQQEARETRAQEDREKKKTCEKWGLRVGFRQTEHLSII